MGNPTSCSVPTRCIRAENCREFVEDLTGHSTRARITGTQPGLETVHLVDYWYMVYTDDEAVVHTVKGTTNGVRRSLKEGLLGDADQIRIARTKTGPFEAIRHFAEFRDLVVQPSKMSTSLTPTKMKAAAKNKPATSIPEPEAVTSPPTPSDSDALATTTIGAPVAAGKAAAAPKSVVITGPRINLRADESTYAEGLKWLFLALIFTGFGVMATFFLPTVIRYVRFL